MINETDIPTLSNPLAPEVTFGFVAASDGVLSSSDEHKKVSYTFTMPADKTDVYIVWRRNGNQSAVPCRYEIGNELTDMNESWPRGTILM